MTKSATNLSFMMLAVFVMSGCSYSSDALFPSLFGSDEQENIASAAPEASADVVPGLGSTNFEPVKVSEGGNTGTFVGQKVVMFRSELTQLQSAIRSNNAQLQQIRASVINNALQYHKVIGMIEAKLQVGTTPGNPNMFAMLDGAQNNIQVMNANTNALSQLAAKVSADAANTDYLVDAIRASYSISGAVDEDHRQLRILENEANQTSILMNSLLNEVNSDIVRQKQYVATASDNIGNLAAAIKVGSYGVNNVPLSGASAAASHFGASSQAVVGSGSPLFVAKLNKAGTKYKEGLKQAVNSARAKKPSVVFDVVAVSPANGSSAGAKSNATQIFQDLIDMGVGADKINLSAKTGNVTSSEVQIFVR
ncbi:MAG: hypothetical protein IJ482_05050 [Alphaproteobacteria bacterium]|nr:hypothetical protein [Alphaproteobacteria bacterium]